MRSPKLTKASGRPPQGARRIHAKQLRRPSKESLCSDCGVGIGKVSVRCRACDSKSKRGLRPDNINAQRIVAAAEKGKYKNMACIATEVGVSRERVRQILNATGHIYFGSRHVRLQWPCPDCRKSITMNASRLRGISHMPSHCRTCAKKYCRRGHREKRAPDGHCGVCDGIRRRRTVEVRTCLECGNDLEISEAFRNQIRLGKSRGEFHSKCYVAKLRREGRPPSRKPLK